MRGMQKPLMRGRHRGGGGETTDGELLPKSGKVGKSRVATLNLDTLKNWCKVVEVLERRNIDFCMTLERGWSYYNIGCKILGSLATS